MSVENCLTQLDQLAREPISQHACGQVPPYTALHNPLAFREVEIRGYVLAATCSPAPSAAVGSGALDPLEQRRRRTVVDLAASLTLPSERSRPAATSTG
ncbi:hypothetical protein [Streptomyces sp. NPDC006668]|uniref:hypothetical protein n=1 Tax=Streptomyces sp. NPDC006668 TaxID=3156903 RepID=UPI0033D5D4BF